MTGADLIALIKKHPIAFAAGTACVLCLATYYFRMDAVTEAQADLDVKEKQAQRTLTNVRYAAGLAEQTAEMEAIDKQFDERLIQAGQLATNLQFFYRLESETGVKLIDIRQNSLPARPLGAKGAYTPIPFSVSVDGTYLQVMTFLRRVETGPSFTRFTAVTFTKAPAAGKEGAPAPDRLTLTLNLETLGLP